MLAVSAAAPAVGARVAPALIYMMTMQLARRREEQLLRIRSQAAYLERVEQLRERDRRDLAEIDRQDTAALRGERGDPAREEKKEEKEGKEDQREPEPEPEPEEEKREPFELTPDLARRFALEARRREAQAARERLARARAAREANRQRQVRSKRSALVEQERLERERAEEKERQRRRRKEQAALRQVQKEARLKAQQRLEREQREDARPVTSADLPVTLEPSVHRALVRAADAADAQRVAFVENLRRSERDAESLLLGDDPGVRRRRIRELVENNQPLAARELAQRYDDSAALQAALQTHLARVRELRQEHSTRTESIPVDLRFFERTSAMLSSLEERLAAHERTLEQEAERAQLTPSTAHREYFMGLIGDVRQLREMDARDEERAAVASGRRNQQQQQKQEAEERALLAEIAQRLEADVARERAQQKARELAERSRQRQAELHRRKLEEDKARRLDSLYHKKVSRPAPVSRIVLPENVRSRMALVEQRQDEEEEEEQKAQEPEPSVQAGPARENEEESRDFYFNYLEMGFNDSWSDPDDDREGN